MTVVALERPLVNSARPSLREAMQQLASGVSLVTSGTAPNRTGCTVTSVVSLSLEPPRVLVCINRAASAYSVVQRCRHFAISILGTQHNKIADRFAGRTGESGEARFAGACWHTLATGSSVLCDALAAVDCEVEEMLERGSHAIVIGHVVAARSAQAGDALVYWRSKYDRLCSELSSADRALWSPIL